MSSLWSRVLGLAAIGMRPRTAGPRREVRPREHSGWVHSDSTVIFHRHQSHNIARLAFCMDQRHSCSISAAGASRSMRQIWTALRHVCPDHLGLHSAGGRTPAWVNRLAERQPVAPFPPPHAAADGAVAGEEPATPTVPAAAGPSPESFQWVRWPEPPISGRPVLRPPADRCPCLRVWTARRGARGGRRGRPAGIGSGSSRDRGGSRRGGSTQQTQHTHTQRHTSTHTHTHHTHTPRTHQIHTQHTQHTAHPHTHMS